MADITNPQIHERLRPLRQGQQEPSAYIAGRYEVVQTMSGGMALVHLCLDHQTGQLVALKTFKPEYLSHRNARDLFLREGTMWVDIGQHSHIVRAYRVERVGDGLEVYLVLEWVVQPEGIDKPSLRSWLVPGRPLSAKQAVTFAIHIARGMKFATRKITGLIHRDLKPENVLVGYDGSARVTDFGLASTLSSLTDLSTGAFTHKSSKAENFQRTQLTQGAAGTPLYMAPEQWLQQPLDARADIYALGCMLYEMVSGRFAAFAETREALQEIHLSGRIKPPPADVPKEVVLFLRKCMMTQRGQRFRHWAEVESALEDVYLRVTGEPFPPERITAAETREERLTAGQSYNSMGLSYLDIGKLSVALMYFEQAVWIAREEESLALEGSGLGNVGLAHQALGYTERAVEFHQENLAIARQIGDRAQEGHAFGNLGRAHRQLGKAEEAVKYHKRELYIAQEIGDRFKEAAALDSLGDTYWQLGNISQAVEYYKQSLALARQIEDRARVKSILSSMGHVYLHSGDVKEAVALFHQALGLARKIGDRVGEGEALADLGYLYHTLNYQDRAIEFYNHALKIAQESHDKRREAITLASIAAIRQEAKAFTEAKNLYETSLAAVEEIDDQLKQMEILKKLGEVYCALGDFMHAASLHKRVLTLADGVGMREIGRQALFDLGRDYEQWGDVGRAIEYYQQHLAAVVEYGGGWELKKNALAKFGPMYARLKQFRASIEVSEQYLEQSRANRDRQAELDALQQLGLVYRVIADTGKAANYYRDALAVARGLHDGEAEAATLSNLALTYYDMGRKWQATRNMEKAMSRAQETKNSLLIATTAYRLALILCKQKKWSKALPYADRAEELFQALQNETMLQRTNKLINAIEEQQERTTGFLF